MTSLFRVLVFAVSLLACPSAGAQADDTERLRIHGSNLLGARLVPALVESWLKDIGHSQIKRRELGPARTEIGAMPDGQPLIVEIDKQGTASCWPATSLRPACSGTPARPKYSPPCNAMPAASASSGCARRAADFARSP